jgi:hypothetical protein
MTDRFINPASVQERRAAWLDQSFLRRIADMGIETLKLERTAHDRMYHGGQDADGCWRCCAIRRRMTRLVLAR